MKALFFSLLTAMMLAHPALAQETPDESESGLACREWFRCVPI